MVILACFALLPVPLPTVHQHDSLESPTELADHLAFHHVGDQASTVDPSDPHWHFKMPFRHGNDDPCDGHASDPPPICATMFSSSLSQGIHLNFDQLRPDDAWGSSVDGSRERSTDALNSDIFRLWQVESALQRHRSAHSCVMRC